MNKFNDHNRLFLSNVNIHMNDENKFITLVSLDY